MMNTIPTFNTLAESEAAKAQAYPEIGKLNLPYIRKGIEDILKLIGRDGIFDEYTLHDITHVDGMLQSLELLVPPTTRAIMTPTEWLLITLACYFHDLGMLVTKDEFTKRDRSGFPHFRDHVLLKGDDGLDYADALSSLPDDQRERFYYQEFVRQHHGERVAHWVMGHTREELGITHQAVEAVDSLLGGLDDKLREDLALICRSHQERSLEDVDHVYVLRRAYGQPPPTHANLQYVAILLRSADLLQIQRQRVPSIMYKLIDPGNPRSQDEWAKQAKVRAILPSRSADAPDGVYDTIEVQAVYDEASGFFGLDSYLQYARTELTSCHEWADIANRKGARHDFPWRFINDDQVEARGFLPQRYQFELDRRKILELLTGHTLYNDSRVAVREIIQNALDTVRFRYYAGRTKNIGSVKVYWTSATRELVVRDDGEGMTREIIEKHLLNVGSSYYQDKTFKENHPEFSSISKFGIGVLSYFMISNDVTIRTVSDDDVDAHEISLPSATQRYLIKTLAKDAPAIKHLGGHGTEVSLRLRPSVRLGSIEKLLRYWLVLPQCPVTLTIDNGAPLSIGWTSVSDALGAYINQAHTIKRGRAREFIIKEEVAADGMQVAYGLEYSPWFKVWELVTRPEDMYYRTARNRGEDDALEQPAGICVEGIRVSSHPPGYTRLGVFALANLTGKGSPRTNVARSDLEQTEELRSTLGGIYAIIGGHIKAEFERMVKDGLGLSKAALEADILMDGFVRGATEPELMKACCDALPIFTIEEVEGKRAVSRRELSAIGSIWTVDDPGMDHVDGLCESLDIRRSSDDILRSLGAGGFPGTPFPRLVGRRGTALLDFEVSEIVLDRERPRIDLKWEMRKDRWRRPSLEMAASLRDKLPGNRGRSLHFAVCPVKCNIPEIQMLEVRGLCLCLQHSAVTKLFDLFGGDEICARWMAHLITSGRIPDDHIPLLRHHLESRGLDESDVIAGLVTAPEHRFKLTDFLRKGSQWYGEWGENA